MSAVKAIPYEKSGGLSVNAKRWMKWRLKPIYSGIHN